MTFNNGYQHLNVPDQWNEYFSKYPNGYTILEAVINWAGQVNDMVDNQNNVATYVNNFMSTFDTDLDQTTKDTLTQWQQDGTLDTIITNALQTDLGDITTLTTTDKSSAVNSINEINLETTSIIKTVAYMGMFPKQANDSDDTARIQRAINSLTGGGVVVLNAETYNISAPISLPSNVILMGKGLNSVIKLLATATCHMVVNSDSTNGNNNIGVLNIKLDGSRSAHVEGTNYGIFFTNVTNGLIQNVYVTATGTDGISLKNSLRCKVLFNTVDNVYEDGISVNYDSGQATDHYHLIMGNKIKNLTYGDALLVKSSHNMMVNNEINGSGAGGLVGGGDGYTINDYNLWSGNKVYNVPANGLAINRGQKNVAIGNEFKSCGRFGVYLNSNDGITPSNYRSADNNIIVGNHIQDIGIGKTTDGSAVVILGSHNLIENNNIENLYGSGVLIQDVTTGTPSLNNSIQGNKMNGVSATGYGVNISSGNNHKILDNEIYSFALDGVSSPAVTKTNTVRGNTITKCRSGVVAISSNGNNIEGNTIYNNTQYGVWLRYANSVGANQNRVVNNKIYDDQTTQTQAWGIFEDTGNDKNLFTLNDCSGNKSGTINKTGTNTLSVNNFSGTAWA